MLPVVQGAVLAAYVLAQILLIVYSSHRYVVLWRWWRARSGAPQRLRRGSRGRSAERAAASPTCPGVAGRPSDWPVVTVQLPVYNERFVVDRLIDAVAGLDYPDGRLEIQVLDDSTDDTAERTARAVARWRARGTAIHHLHRRTRSGFKAGALSYGLAHARGDLIAVFDADFVPAPDFLRRLVPGFCDPSVGMVQARWGHLNRDRSPLTAAQAVMLDAHFLLEHAARMGNDLFFNFNGTAGIWRRACLVDAGGWSNDTLTEDLDLSYRAQLRGWRFVFDGGAESPAELPGDIDALKSQQRRWAKGSIQTARKLLPRVFETDLPARLKIEAFFHLTANVAYPLLLVLGLLLLPVLLGESTTARWLVWIVQIGVMVFGILPVGLFLMAGQRVAGGGLRHMTCDVLSALVLGVGLSLNNARAVLEGLGSRLGRWERTPKTGDDGGRVAGTRGYAAAEYGAGWGEIALALYFGALAGFAWRHAYLHAVPFLLLLLTGFGSVGVASLRASLGVSRRTGVGGRRPAT